MYNGNKALEETSLHNDTNLPVLIPLVGIQVQGRCYRGELLVMNIQSKNQVNTHAPRNIQFIW